ncbi:MAG: hypothetical protein KY460_06185 [Actinobacteria bacterium]|nr:hypothetical protein [Actinomycetota bacterium]
MPVTVAMTGVPDTAWQARADGPVEAAFDAVVDLEPDTDVILVLTWALGRDPDSAMRRALTLRRPPPGRPTGAAVSRRDRWPALPRSVPASVRPLVRRGLAYARACCTLPTATGTAVVTDHRILPLSWTRDAYYAVAALVAADATEANELLLAHLHWLFAAERLDGAWGGRTYRTGA